MRTGCGYYQECQAAQGKAVSDPTSTLTPALITASVPSEPNYYFVPSSLWERCFQGLLPVIPLLLLIPALSPAPCFASLPWILQGALGFFEVCWAWLQITALDTFLPSFYNPSSLTLPCMFFLY